MSEQTRRTLGVGRAAFTVYGSDGTVATFEDDGTAYAWAVNEHAETGATYECRDEAFDHVFTVER